MTHVVAELIRPRLMGAIGQSAPTDFVGLFWTRETQSIGPISLEFEGHSGGDPGVMTFMYKQPGSDTAFVVMFNGEVRHMGDVLALVRLVRQSSKINGS